MTTKTEIARILGVDPESISVHNPDYASLLKEGVTISPHVSYWRGQTRLTFNQLGLWFETGDEKKVMEGITKLGKLYLYPPEVIKALISLETQIRNLPKKYGIETAFGAFVPVTIYPELKEAMDELTEKFQALQNEIGLNWEENLAKTELNIRVAARFAYRNKAGDPKTRDEIQNENAFIDKFVKAVKALIPSKQTVLEGFSLSFELRYIPLPDILAAEKARAEVEEAQAQAEVRRIFTDRQVDRERVESERRANADREKILYQMNQDIADQARAQAQELMDNFFRKLVSESRQLAIEVYQDVAKGIKRQGKVHGRSVVALRNLITQVSKLATFYGGDVDIETILKPARQILNDLPEARIARIDDYLEGMKEIRQLANEQLDKLGVKPRSSNNLTVAPVEVKRGNRRGKAPVTVDPVTPLKVNRRGQRNPIEIG